MKPSKAADVGQMRRRKGISMKIIMKAETLEDGQLAGHVVVSGMLGTYRHMMLKIMTRLMLKRLATPRAKQRSTQMMPILVASQLGARCVRCCI